MKRQNNFNFNDSLKSLVEKQEELVSIIQKTNIGEVDVSLNSFHAFIRREFLYELDKWFQSKIFITNVQSPIQNSALIGELKNNEIVENKITIIASLIISKMSDVLKAQFHAVYADDDENSAMMEYIIRHLLFYIKKVNTDISIMFESENTQDIDSNNLLEAYFLSIENEIYDNNGIEIIKNQNATSSPEESVPEEE